MSVWKSFSHALISVWETIGIRFKLPSRKELFLSASSLQLNLSWWSVFDHVWVAIRQPDAGCCHPQRKNPGMEGSQGVERALPDNGQPPSVGRPELKTKVDPVRHCQPESIGTFFSFYLRRRDLNICAFWPFVIVSSDRRYMNFLCVPSGGNAQEMHLMLKISEVPEQNVWFLPTYQRPFPGTRSIAVYFISLWGKCSATTSVFTCRVCSCCWHCSKLGWSDDSLSVS